MCYVIENYYHYLNYYIVMFGTIFHFGVSWFNAGTVSGTVTNYTQDPSLQPASYD